MYVAALLIWDGNGCPGSNDPIFNAIGGVGWLGEYQTGDCEHYKEQTLDHSKIQNLFA